MRTRLPKDMFLSTTIMTNGEECDVCVCFDVDRYSPGCAERICYDENDHSAEPAEYEFSFIRAEFDGGPDEPLTDAEINSLKVWFDANHSKACEEANEHMRE